MDPVVIIGTRSEGLTVLDVERHAEGMSYAHLEIAGTGLVANSTVFMWLSSVSLDKFLSSLADDWRGWKGEREWNSGGELSLRARHAGSHVDLVIGMRRDGFWRAQVEVTVEVGAELSGAAAAAAAALGDGTT